MHNANATTPNPSANSRDLVRHLSAVELSESAVMALPLAEARRALIPFRATEGFRPVWTRLLTRPDENLKLRHSGSDRVAAYGLSLSPADSAGWNVCRFATAGCRAACLATSGKGAFSRTQAGRMWKTKALAESPVAFLRVLVAEIDAIPVDKWSAAGFTVSMRLNVLSDLPWEAIAPWLLRRITGRGIVPMDYTKWPVVKRAGAIALGYDLSCSVSERTTDAEIALMRRPVAVVDVRRGQPLPTEWMGRTVVDGDRSDARFLDSPDAAVLLRFKNVTTTDRAAAVASGFVRAVA